MSCGETPAIYLFIYLFFYLFIYLIIKIYLNLLKMLNSILLLILLCINNSQILLSRIPTATLNVDGMEPYDIVLT